MQLEIATPGFEDGVSMSIYAEHAGMTGLSDFGVTTNPEATCNPDGSASETGNSVAVVSGKVSFYICSASDFVAVPSSGSITITTPVTGTIFYTFRPSITGTGTVSGATVTLRLSGTNSTFGTATIA